MLVVVNDRRDLYAEILERAGLDLEERLLRHVNRRTGRRAGEYFEDDPRRPLRTARSVNVALAA